MSNSSKTYWAISIAGIDDLPPCPKDIQEPLYAELMFAQRPYCLVSAS